MVKHKLFRLISVTIISLYLFIFTGINLFKSEYDDPPYNYLTKNWLNSPINDIELLDSNKISNLNEHDNQNILAYFNSDSIKKDLNIFHGKYFNIKTNTDYKYCNFVGYFHKKSENKQCGKDTQGNILYFPKDTLCPLNFILISKNNTVCKDNFNISCKYQKLNNDLYLVTSNENISGIILTQLRINYKNKICANSKIDITFNNLLQNYENQNCDNDWNYDLIYEEIYQEELINFSKENDLKNIKIIKNENISLSYRGYLGVDELSKYSEHPVDHVTYARNIAISKNIILFISCFYSTFYSGFTYLFEKNNKYYFKIKIMFFVYCVLFVFNFLFNSHVIFTFFRVKEIVSTVNLEGIYKYKSGIRSFIVFDILIMIGLAFDYSLNLYNFLLFRRNHNIINDDNNNDNNNNINNIDNEQNNQFL